MNETIRADLFRYYQHDYSIVRLLLGLRSRAFRYLFFKRLSNRYSVRTPHGFVYKIMERHYSHKFGFQIEGQIGKGFYIGHFGTIVVNKEARLGNNCNIAPGVTIGETSRGENAGVPTIGDYVWIGTNAVVVGKITIGSNVLIAPGAYVNFDVPTHSIVLGNPGKIISRENPTEGYIRFCLPD
ncbi:MAG: serine acetyltransferase [Gemmatimonas sp.]